MLFFLNVTKQIKNLCLNRNIQRRRRFVSNNDVRLAGNGNRDDHALAHPSGKLMRIHSGNAFRLRNPDLIKQFDHAGLLFFFRHRRVEIQIFFNLVSDPHQRIQSCQRILENHAHVVSAKSIHLIRAHSDKFMIFNRNRTVFFDDSLVINNTSADLSRTHIVQANHARGKSTLAAA